MPIFDRKSNMSSTISLKITIIALISVWFNGNSVKPSNKLEELVIKNVLLCN